MIRSGSIRPRRVSARRGVGSGPWLLALLVLSGCGSEQMTDLTGWMEQIRARPPRPIEPLPRLEPVSAFVYDPADRRDPFVMDASTAAEPMTVVQNDLAPDPTRRKEELESYSLDSIRMVGTLEQEQVLWGLVRTQEGILHRVRVGHYMGMNNGQIVQIDEDEIQLTEIVSDGPGQWRERAATVALSE